MAGIYVHIPYCKKRCSYCDFHSSTDVPDETTYLSLLKKELDSVHTFLSDKIIGTIYFGGGTPSVFNPDFFKRFVEIIKEYYSVENNAEITIEVNPDDMDIKKAFGYRRAGINRISIGIQSFDDAMLTFFNRRHTAKQAIQSVHRAKKAGFDNISIDLIYGIPGQRLETWITTLKKAFELPICHLSAYHLTIEKQTPLYKQLQQGQITLPNEDVSYQYYNALVEESAKHGFEHYEISNFCRKNAYSAHNSSYWKGIQYLGLGPSAHSYNGTNRRWNISDNKAYQERICEGIGCYEEETLTEKEKFIEYLITRLRTKWGMDYSDIKSQFGLVQNNEVLKRIEKWKAEGFAEVTGAGVRLTEKGFFISDRIIGELIV
jgi:putative oxygen-independent coproporphyrinogen III oxidase